MANACTVCGLTNGQPRRRRPCRKCAAFLRKYKGMKAPSLDVIAKIAAKYPKYFNSQKGIPLVANTPSRFDFAYANRIYYSRLANDWRIVRGGKPTKLQRRMAELQMLEFYTGMVAQAKLRYEDARHHLGRGYHLLHDLQALSAAKGG
jgi:hypothetical protein